MRLRNTEEILLSTVMSVPNLSLCVFPPEGAQSCCVYLNYDTVLECGFHAQHACRLSELLFLF